MATDTPSTGRQPIPPAKRKMLQQLFEHGSKVSASGNFDYAADSFTKCITGDPANMLYAQSFLANLQKKYNNNKTGAKLAGMRAAKPKAGVKTAKAKKDWTGVIASGLEVLKLNPWDTGALADMAAACEQLQFDECQIVYLKGALEADIKEPETNRLLGRALAKQGQFDQAIACFMRVQQAKPNDEEARRAIANLQCEKTIHKGGYEDAETSTQVMADKQSQAERQGAGGLRVSPEQALEKKIAKDPANMSFYLELADLHLKDDRFNEAEQVLERALQASGGGNIEIRENLEDVQVRHARHQVAIARKRAEAEKTDEAVGLYQQMQTELNSKELEIYRARCERHPANIGYRYELGVRLERAKNFQEAIKVLQEARGDQKRKGMVLLHLGVCFESIKQPKLALANYEASLEFLAEREPDNHKLALYRAGVVAMDRLKDYEKAEKHLTAVAGLDFGYKDVSDRLDKLHKIREDGES